MRNQIDPKVDYAFKHVFGREQSKPALMSLLDAVLQPAAGGKIASLELLNPFNEKENLDDKLSVLDIKARDESGRQFNVEMQIVGYGAFRQRLLYYWSRLHQAQLGEGDEYVDLRPTISVCFLDTPLFTEIPDYDLVFELRERRHQTLFTDQMAVHILELAKFNKAVDELASSLDRWMYFLRHADELDGDALPPALDVAEVRWALEGLIMISQSDRDRELYESRLKMRRDITAALDDARTEGEATGEARGEARGQIARIHSLQRLLHSEMTPPDQLQMISLAELEGLAARLEAKLNAKLGNGS